MRMLAITALTRGLSLAGVLSIASLGTGCLRLGYREVDSARGLTPDAGASRLMDSGAADSGKAGAGAHSGGSDAHSGGSNSGGVGGSRAAGAGGAAGKRTTSNAGSAGDAAGAGSGGTSAIIDAGMDAGDAATDAGSESKCPERPEALFCDGFEDPNFTRWNYPLTMNGTVEQSTAQVRTGTASLRATTGSAGNMNEARYSTALLANQKSGDIWLRYYNYLPSSTLITTHFSSGVISEVTPPYDGLWVMVLPNRVDLGSWVDYYDGNQAFPRDRWVCVELHVHVDTSAGLFELFLDGSKVASSGMVNSVPAKGFTTAEIGIHYADTAQGPVEVFVEDVVLARVRVPCD